MNRHETNRLKNFTLQFPLEVARTTLDRTFTALIIPDSDGDGEYYRELAEIAMANLIMSYLGQCKLSMVARRLLIVCPNFEIQKKLIANIRCLEEGDRLANLLKLTGLIEVEAICIMYAVGNNQQGRQITVPVELEQK